MSFEFQVVLTTKCNMACKYCYMPNIPKVMKRDVFLRHFHDNLPLLMNAYCTGFNFNSVMFGGEPTLNPEILVLMATLLKNDPNSSAPVLITNGLNLTEDLYKFYLDLGLVISWSFDGFWNLETRVGVKGNETYYTYLSKLELFKKLGNCKVMISPDSIDDTSMLANYMFFVDTMGFSSPMYALVRDDIWEKKDVQRFRSQSLQLVKYILKQNEKRKDGSYLGVPHIYALAIQDLIYAESYGKRPFGCFAGCKGAGFMPDGSVYPCARFWQDRKFELISKSGKLNHQNFEIMLEKSDISSYAKCLKCPFYESCNAGCLYSQIKNGDKPLSAICDLYSIIREHATMLLQSSNPDFKAYLRRTTALRR